MWNGRRFHTFDYDCRKRFGTKLYKLSLNAGFTCPNRDGTLGTRGCLAIIPEDIAIHRITGDGPKKLLLAPMWSANKRMVLNAIEKEMKQRDFLQGCALKAKPTARP